MSDKLNVLIVDDEPHICEVIRLYAEHAGFETIIAHNGETAMHCLHTRRPSLVLLDVMLPDESGFDICHRIRKGAEETSQVPIIFLTAKGEPMDKLRGFNLGVDDYIVKPFDPNELIARIKAVLRRAAGSQCRAEPAAKERTLQFANLSIDLVQYKVQVGEERIDLTPKEIELLHFMASNPNRVFTREDLLGHVWDFDFSGGTRTVDAHVKNLRKKLGFHDDWRIETLWGVGYSFEVKRNG